MVRLATRLPLPSWPHAVGITALLLISLPMQPLQAAPPVAERKPVTDTYHGVAVTEDYRWLEDSASADVRTWTAGQNAHTRGFLDALPARAPIHKRLEQLSAAASASYRQVKPAGNRLLALKRQPPLEQPLLVSIASPDAPETERILLDPNVQNSKGTTSIDGFYPSPDGTRVAVILADAGSERGNLVLLDAVTGAPQPDRIERVSFPTGGGSVAWDRDSRGFFYTRYPRAGERPPADLAFYEQLYHHALGDAESADTYCIGKEFPRIGEVFPSVSPDGRHLLVTVQDGDGGDFTHWLRGPDQKWNQITRFADGVKSIVFGPGHQLYLVSRKDAPRGRILKLPVDRPILSEARVIVPEGEGVIVGYDWQGLDIVPAFAANESGLWVIEMLGGPSRVRRFKLDGSSPSTLPLPPVSAVGAMVPLPDRSMLLSVGTFLTPTGWFRADAAKGGVHRTALVEKSPVTFDDCEVLREFATSKDGTRVPVSIIQRRGTKRNGNNPTLLTGYGGYGINITPKFLGAEGRLWLDQGGVHVVANLRGGGEYGGTWHSQGSGVNKQNVFDDFAACARHLIARNYTQPSRLAIEGGSNGGLLMGASLTQHPELFRAVVTHVGIYDMLRVELEPNGAFNVPEFGTVKNSEQFRALHAYSPYHHVTAGMKYPAVFFMTGDNDGRVNPSNSRKMTARLQAATASGEPILLRTSASSGHGSGTARSEVIQQEADVLSFLFNRLGVPYKETTPASVR
jgi:prolyl oligopeptidase